MMHIDVLVFGRLREIVGQPTVAVAGEARTVRDVWGLVAAQCPRLSQGDAAVRPAVNEAFTTWDTRVAQGDRVAFLPPMSGG